MKFVGMIYTDNGELISTINAQTRDRVYPHIKGSINKIKFEEISLEEWDIKRITNLFEKICEMI